MGANGPDQSKCNLSGEKKLYCKVTSNTCPPTSATCQPLPTITPATLTKAKTLPMGTWKKAAEQMDWWSASDLCDAIKMELPNKDAFCGSDCNAVATPRKVKSGLDFWWSNSYGGGLWLSEKNSCNAYAGNVWNGDWKYYVDEPTKSSVRQVICAPKNYTEPDCPNGETYNVSTDSCDP